MWELNGGEIPFGRRLKRTCEGTLCVNPKHQIIHPPNPEHPWVRELYARLESKGMTILQAAQVAGISQDRIYEWIRHPKQEATLELLEQLVNFLDAPELLRLRPIYSRTPTTMTCTACGATKEYSTKQLRRGLSGADHEFSSFNDAEVDVLARTGTYICGSCARSRMGSVRYKRKRRRLGKKKMSRRMRAMGRQVAPENVANKWEAAAAKNLGRRRTPEQRARIAVGLIGLTHNGTFGICRVCKGVIYAWRSASRSRHPRGETHQACYREWRRKHPRQRGEPTKYPPKLKGRQPSAEELLVSLQITAQYANGAPLKDLAAKFNLSRSGIYKCVDAFLSRLPPDARGGPHVSAWGRLLPPAVESRRTRE